MKARALIAEDEPLLAQALVTELRIAWPELDIVAMVGDGHAAVDAALERLPDVLFLDIRMPGQDGLGAAADIADAWPTDRAPLPQLVFVTAFDQYAVRAFEAQAADYVLKPVQPARLRQTVERLHGALRARSAAPWGDEPLAATLARWHELLAAAGSAQDRGSAPPAALRMLNASEPGSNGQRVRLVPIDEVIYFEAADKYVRVIASSGETLIRMPLRQLLPQLDAQRFWQIHRAVVVRADAIETVLRDEAGRLQVCLRNRPERLAVSRLYGHLFRAM